LAQFETKLTGDIIRDADEAELKKVNEPEITVHSPSLLKIR
jgi:hypothetical protein